MTPEKPSEMPNEIWAMDNNTYSKYPEPNAKGGYPREGVEHRTRTKYIRADLSETNRAEVVEELERAYAKVGKLSDENDQLKSSERKRNDWLYKAKLDAGYSQNTSFDDVWRDALVALLEKNRVGG